MKWAFEYACKICEEQLPNTLPLNIHEKNGKRVIAALKIRNYATLPRSIHNPAEPHTVMPVAARQRTACDIPQGKYGVFGQQTRRFCIVNTANLHCKHGEFTLPLAANVKTYYYQKDAQRPSKSANQRNK